MDCKNLLVAVLLLSQHIFSIHADNYTENRYTRAIKTGRCSSRHYCRTEHGSNKHPTCEKQYLTPCMKSRELFKSFGGKLVLCDTETDSEAWIIIQRRFNGQVNFKRNWADYKNGFGTLDSEFWIGNELIYQLTNNGYTELRFDLTYRGQSFYAVHSNFKVQNEASQYYMTVGSYTGNAGERFGYLGGIGFTTIDRDNDVDHNNNNCADYYHGGWWYKGCHNVNINGQWGNTGYGEGLTWYPLTSFYTSVSSVEMKVRKPNPS